MKRLILAFASLIYVTILHLKKAFPNVGLNVALNGTVVAEWISVAGLRQHKVNFFCYLHIGC
jgi:hypothetical protein